MIPFTQYVRPDGRRRAVEVERSPEIEQLAQEFIAGGGSYECEELTTGHASLTAVHPDCEAGDCAIEVVMNGPEVPAAVDRVVRSSIAWMHGSRSRAIRCEHCKVVRTTPITECGWPDCPQLDRRMRHDRRAHGPN